MKKVFLSLVMSALFLIGSLSMVSMAPPPPDKFPCKDFCSEAVPEGIFSTTGKCLSACNVCTNPAENLAQEAVCICKTSDAFGGPATPQNQCVQIVKDDLRGN